MAVDENLKKALDGILEAVEDDDTLTQELRDSITNLAVEAIGDPTPANLKALAIVLEKLGQTERYFNSLAIVKGAM